MVLFLENLAGVTRLFSTLLFSEVSVSVVNSYERCFGASTLKTATGQLTVRSLSSPCC